MVFRQDAIHLIESYNFKLNDSVLIKLEDAVRHKRDMLVTIDASHYGFRNGNGTIYRHDTVAMDIPTFVSPEPKPIIQMHRPETSERFGRVIAADYKLTDYYQQFADSHDLEGLSTDQYIDLCKNVLLPYQRKNAMFNGLAYVQVVGKLDHSEGISRVLDGEFLTVSIGAIPGRLICSECGQNQLEKICRHYAHKTNDVFMLSESLEYEELSFVRKPADPFGRIIRIHDGQIEETRIERETNCLSANVDVVDLKDFFKQAEGKKIVCVDNICTIINQEDEMARKKDVKVTSLSYVGEFTEDKVKGVQLQDAEAAFVNLTEDELIALKDSDFAIVQKLEDGLKRRFPISTKENVEIGLAMLDSAEDVTESERERAYKSLVKAAKKFGIEIKDGEQTSAEETSAEETNTTDEGTAHQDSGEGSDEGTEGTQEPEKRTLEQILDELQENLKGMEEPENLEDSMEIDKNPVGTIFSILQNLAGDIKFIGGMLDTSVTSYLINKGKEAVEKGAYDSLNDTVKSLEDQLTEANEEIELLDEQNRELNYQLRTDKVDELIAIKSSIGLIDSEKVEEERTKLSKLSYNILQDQISDFRKVKLVIKDSAVNNKVEIKKIADPTHADSVEGDASSDAISHQDSQQELELTFDEKVALFKSLLKK